MPTFNVITKLYENDQGEYETYSEARMIKWKCDKCSDLSDVQNAIQTQTDVPFVLTN